MQRAQAKSAPRPSRNLRRLLAIGAAVGAAAGIATVFLLPRSAPPPQISVANPLPAAVGAPEVPSSPSGPEDIARAARLARVPAIMFHDIVRRKDVWFDTTVEEFRAQLEAIRAAGATPITIDQFHEHLKNGAPLPAKPILLTFDDGYLGHLENAYPLLKEFNYPAVFFVHTAYVGVLTGKPHMDWDQIKQIDSEGLVSIQSHTITHPADLRTLDAAALERELVESKRILEQKLGHPVHYLAYPVGNQDERVRQAAIQAGYRLSFTMDLGYAGQSGSLLALQRFIDSRLPLALANVGAVADTRVNMEAPVTLHEQTHRRVRLVWLSGGNYTTRHSEGNRSPVGDFIEREQAVGGINGGFFAFAGLRATNSDMVGPYLSQNEGRFVPGAPEFDKSLRGRPVVLISATGLRFVPYSPETFDTEAEARAYLSDLSDLFVAGVWLVNNGQALTTEQIEQFRLSNHSEFRRRTFMGIDKAGLPRVGATLTNVNATQLARALEEAGLREAVLLDSGFSTSLVHQGKVLVTGHTAPSIPSRIIPHAVLVHPPL
ncbi:polysaccharide deacetylase family protein [Gloeobacter morelensis]|uniref:Polysaccharide deacetylase family protein n=1 Tax=Gloeobacter morelensis MG652769 TaxID=2781736 RepID=A0ABY3PLI8_9CYAN|nr:polysaccharide deacetylase family protein [Gloeobacter morelensis]UFP94523.1 polysaccharide deacetylase family protein [Gloeobacter morelensis MG652769]